MYTLLYQATGSSGYDEARYNGCLRSALGGDACKTLEIFYLKHDRWLYFRRGDTQHVAATNYANLSATQSVH